MKGAIVCDRIDLNRSATVRSVVEALAAEAARSSCWDKLEVKGGYYFATPRRRLPASPGWYVICNENRRPLYAGWAKNLNNRLNSPTGSIDNFANSTRKRDPLRNFIKAFRTHGVIRDLQAVFITESALCDRIGITAPLSTLDRGNVEKLLNVFRERILNMDTVSSCLVGETSGADPLVRSADFEWITQLCRLHRPPLVPVSWYPPAR